jgi:hypothetical protein
MSGQNPALYIRVAATLDELRKNVAEAKGGIETTTAAMQKLASSFSGDKIIQAAHNVTAAVNSIGGASKLTEAEQARVNATVEKALEKYRALGREAPAHMVALAEATRAVEPATSALNKTFGDMGSQIKATALGFVGAQAILGGVQSAFSTFTEFLKSSVQSYASAEAAAKKMTTALQAQGRATPDVIAQYDALATQFQSTTVYSDDLINEMQALLVQVGNVMPGEMEKALTAATNLASGLGIDLQQATMLVGKAFAGETGTLSRYGIVIDEAKLKAQGMPAVLEAIQAKFGGQAQSEVDTYSGRIKQLANEWDNLQEAVGKSIVRDPLIAAALRLVADQAKVASSETGGLATTFVQMWSNLAGNGAGTAAYLAWLSAVADQSNRAAEGMKILASLKPAINHQTTAEQDAEAERKKAAAAKAATEALAAAHKLAAEAAKRHAEVIEDLFRQYSGAVAAQKMADLDVVFRRLEGDAKTTEVQLRAIVRDAADLARQGAVLTPGLFSMAMAFGELNPKVTDGIDGMGQLGQKFSIAIPAVSELAKALPNVTVGIDNLIGHMPKMDLGFQFGEFTKRAKEGKDAVLELGQAFGQMSSMASGSLASVLGGVADLILSLHDALKMTQQAFGGEEGGGSSGNGIAKIAMMVTGWGAVAFAAYKAGKAIYTAMNDGRKAVSDFADSFGGFDNLHQRLLDSLGGVGEQFWIQLTQEVGRGDQNKAKQVIDRINKALADALANAPETLAAAAGYQTIEQLQKVADQARIVYEYMRDSGKFTAAAVEDAFKKATDAAIAAMGSASAAAYNEAVKARDAAQTMLDGINSQIKTLQAAVDAEAPEEFMGVVEQLQRKQLEALEEKRAKAAATVEELNARIDDAAAAAVEAARKAAEGAGESTVTAIREALEHERFKVHVDVDGLPTGVSVPQHGTGGYFDRPHMAVIGDQPEYITPRSSISQLAREIGANGGAGRPDAYVPATIHLEGAAVWTGLLRVAKKQGVF